MSSSKRYERHNILADTSIFNGYLGNYELFSQNILERLSKDLGFSYELYKALYSIDKDSAATMVKSVCSHDKISEIIFLVDDDNRCVLDYTLDVDRLPILNSEFIARVKSIASTSSDVLVDEIHHLEEDKLSYVVLRKKEPIIIEEKYENEEKVDTIEYTIGVILSNDEVGTTSSRLVLYVDGQPLYLPASYYNSTTSRYKRSTSNSVEALEVLLLKIIDDLREEALYSKIYDLHFRYRANKNILASYEEYNSVLRVMRKVPTIIEDNSILDTLLSKYEEFEKKYSRLEDQRGSYIWRCTALSDITVGALISITSRILSDLSAPPIEYTSIRELLGTYLSTNRIAEEIAKEDI